MGTKLNNLNRIPPVIDEFEDAGGVVWIVGRIDRPGNCKKCGGRAEFVGCDIFGCSFNDDGRGPEIHIQGVTLDEAAAVAMCINETYFVGPMLINVLLPQKPIPWAGLYFPLKIK